MESDEVLKAELEKAVAECARLREENARLRLRVRESPDTLPPTPRQCSGWALKRWNLKGISKSEYTETIIQLFLQGITASSSSIETLGPLGPAHDGMRQKEEKGQKGPHN